MSALIGALRVSLSADTANFEAGMKRAQRSTRTAANEIQRDAGYISRAIRRMAAGLTVGLFIQAGKDALEYAGHLGELADTLGLTTKDLQTFSYAAGQVGISQEELQVGIQKLTISMGQAELGAKKQTVAFEALFGKTALAQIQGKNAGEVFRMIAEKLETVSDRSQRAAVEVALFGKAGAKLDNLLSGSQGKLSELSDAAERLGIVLSDEQIRKADETADKIDALKTVLKAKIASSVADDSNAILQFADSLVEFVSMLDKAGRAFLNFQSTLANNFSLPALYNRLVKGRVYGYGVAGQSVTVPLPPASPFNKKPKLGGAAGISPFLGGGGGGGRHSGGGGGRDRSAEDAARKAFEFDQEIRRAQIDVLNATKDLASDYIERGAISLQILEAEKDAYNAELDYKVKSGDLTKAQADALRATNDKKDALEKDAVWAELNAQRSEDVFNLGQHDLDRRKDVLQAQEQIATTAAERRKIELELLDIAYQQKKQALEYTIATSKDIAAVEDARRDLLNLNKTYAADRQGVMMNTQNPLEQWASTVPQTSAQITEALQGIEANGLDGIAGAIAGIVSGTESMGEAFQQVAKQMIAEITAVIIKMLLLKAIQAATGAMGGGGGFGGSAGVDIGSSAVASGTSTIDTGMIAGLPGFAKGGAGVFGGRGGTDNNILSMNGLPIARVSRGEAWAIGPQALAGAGGTVINFHISGNPTRETMNQVAARTRSALQSANRAGV